MTPTRRPAVPGARDAERPAARAATLAATAALLAVALHASRLAHGPGPRPVPVDPVDVNAAGPEELSILPGVGPSLAAAIVADRDARGPFASASDLDRVRGVGPATLAGLRPHVTAGPAYAAR